MTRRALERLAAEAGEDPVAREHVSAYFKEHRDFVKVAEIGLPKKWRFKGARLSIDTPADVSFIETVYQRQREAGLVVLALNVGQSREVAARFARGLGISYEVALDQDAAVSGQYGVVGLPLTYFVDRQGRVRNKILGEASPDAFEAVATALLKEPSL